MVKPEEICHNCGQDQCILYIPGGNISRDLYSPGIFLLFITSNYVFVYKHVYISEILISDKLVLNICCVRSEPVSPSDPGSCGEFFEESDLMLRPHLRGV